MRRFPLLAVAAMAFLAPGMQARERQDLHEQVRYAVERTDKDLGDLVPRDKLSAQQRDKFDAAVKDLHALGEAVADGKWEGERGRLEHAIANMDSVVKDSSIAKGDRQTLDIDLYTLRVTLENWKP